MHRGARVSRDTKCRVGQARNLVVTTSPEVLFFFLFPPIQSGAAVLLCRTVTCKILFCFNTNKGMKRTGTSVTFGSGTWMPVRNAAFFSLLAALVQLPNSYKTMMPTVPRLSSHGPKTGTGAGSQLLGLNESLEAHNFEERRVLRKKGCN